MILANGDAGNSVLHWRRAAIIVSLLMVLLAAFFVMLFSRGIDRELYYIATTSEIRQQSELVLLNLVEMDAAERNFSQKRDDKDYERFLQASERLSDVISYITLISHSHPEVKIWLSTLSDEIGLRLTTMKTRMDIMRKMSGEDASKALQQEPMQPTTEHWNAVAMSYFNDENNALVKRREKLDVLRAALFFSAIVAMVSTFVLAYGVINRFRRDVLRMRAYQRLLHKEKIELEARVKQRTIELETARNYAEKERQRVELLLQDTSHRIGNSLATVSSLLGLQANRTQNEEVHLALISARDRIQTIATSHRRLRLGTDMETTVFGDFLRAVVHDIELSMPLDLRKRVTITTKTEFWCLASRDATTLGIIAGELLTNAIKHAFPEGQEGKIFIFFGKWRGGALSLIIQDNGIGMGRKSKNSKEIGLGKLVVQQLCLQFGGEPRYKKLRNGGTFVTIPLSSLEEQAKNKDSDE